ncbi:MAG: carboxymuconolactone decarboxylase family protein [Chloroflexi bacterium]|nr:carboxymuconolactone decarboxylase family protein [Chloroflexota bacterium]
MANLLTDSEATGKAKEVFQEINAMMGMVPNFFRAQAAADPEWLELNWTRWKSIMGRQRQLDRKTKEIVALAVSLTNNCQYCSLAHETMALMVGATETEITEVKEVIELFESFNSIANTLQIPCDITPAMVKR